MFQNTQQAQVCYLPYALIPGMLINSHHYQQAVKTLHKAEANPSQNGSVSNGKARKRMFVAAFSDSSSVIEDKLLYLNA
jgi:hypothetical protein